MSKRRSVIQIVEGGLRLIGADGLFSGEECGCHVDDLAPCGSIGHGCVAAMNDPKEAKEQGCDFWMRPIAIDEHVEIVEEE